MEAQNELTRKALEERCIDVFRKYTPITLLEERGSLKNQELRIKALGALVHEGVPYEVSILAERIGTTRGRLRHILNDEYPLSPRLFIRYKRHINSIAIKRQSRAEKLLKFYEDLYEFTLSEDNGQDL